MYELAPCIVCGHAHAEEIADADALRKEVEALWSFHMHRLRPTTPPSQLADRVAFSQHAPLRLARCSTCGLVYRSPRERAQELAATYGDDTLDESMFETLFENQRASYRVQARRLTRVLGRRGSGLEIGSYVGAFLAAARDQGWSVEGVDINARANAFARRKGFSVVDGEIGDVDPKRRVDAVALWNCFDQLTDPRGAAAAARRLLRPDGVMAVRVPNGAFYAAVRPYLSRGPLRHAARLLLAHNNLLAFPYRVGHTPRSLAKLLAAVGLRVVAVRGDVLVPIADRWTRRWAATEEQAVKRLLKLLALLSPHLSPWLEVYARPDP